MLLIHQGVCWNWPFQSRCGSILRKNPLPDWCPGWSPITWKLLKPWYDWYYYMLKKGIMSHDANGFNLLDGGFLWWTVNNQEVCPSGVGCLSLFGFGFGHALNAWWTRGESVSSYVKRHIIHITVFQTYPSKYSICFFTSDTCHAEFSSTPPNTVYSVLYLDVSAAVWHINWIEIEFHL